VPDEHEHADGRRDRALGCDGRVERLVRNLGQHLAGTLACADGVSRIRLDDRHRIAGEPERLGVDPGEAELEHARGRREQFEDSRRRARRERRREPLPRREHVGSLTEPGCRERG
jgi:hypothetical protein